MLTLVCVLKTNRRTDKQSWARMGSLSSHQTPIRKCLRSKLILRM